MFRKLQGSFESYRYAGTCGHKIRNCVYLLMLVKITGTVITQIPIKRGGREIEKHHYESVAVLSLEQLSDEQLLNKRLTPQLKYVTGLLSITPSPRIRIAYGSLKFALLFQPI